MKQYDIIVIGAGHAGIEAALAASRMGLETLLITLKRDNIGLMSCNPAIGGVGKGQIVKEIDALGGEMAKAADACGIQFRLLNASKGPAVQSSRAQEDRKKYQTYMHNLLQHQENLEIKETEVSSLLIEDNFCRGIKTRDNQEILSRAVVLCPGTFLNGLIHVGLKHFPGGRIAETAALDLSRNLKELSFKILRFKTGTCPRLDKTTINYANLKIQEGDRIPRPFSFSTRELNIKQLPCFITHTNLKTHRLITENLNQSPLYTGKIQATGVRYCPSIEDKVVRFYERERHQIFLEPDGTDSLEVYPNGISTSLPEEVQLAFLHSILGLEEVEVIRFGYGIEHDVVEPRQLKPTLETKLIENLYLAGQINGTTGYEEAAGQGLLAGINAALKIFQRPPLVLERSSSYVGVLIDDLVTKGTNEPYRMFTSRVEYRLVLREDNADLRLRKLGFELGLVNQSEYNRVVRKEAEIQRGLKFFKETKITAQASVKDGLKMPRLKKTTTLEELLKRPEIKIEDFAAISGFPEEIEDDAWQQIEIETKYAGFVQRQLAEIEKFRNLEKIKLSPDLDYALIPSLSREIKEKLNHFHPFSLGQASRISGVTPAAISILLVYLKKLNG